MKIFVLILGIYFLALPCLACAENESCTNEVQSFLSGSDNHNNHEEDDCGAFCTCTCCAHVITVNHQIPEIVFNNCIEDGKAAFMYDSVNIPSNYFGNIWQPPKIC